MRIGLFVPCYIDQLYPDVAMATLELLEASGAEVVFPPEQTCCGQPMANSGCWDDARPIVRRFVDIFEPANGETFDYVVCPSGSCTSMVRHHFSELLVDETTADAALQSRLDALQRRTLDLAEFLTRVVPYATIAETFAQRHGPIRFPHRIGLHQSCHGLRELRLGPSSERMDRGVERDGGTLGQLLRQVDGVELVELSRTDECCGFGGTFAVNEEAVSVMMGRDRLADHDKAGSTVIVAGDMSCLMHLEGLIRRERQPVKVMHLAQVLTGRPLPEQTSLQEFSHG